MKTKSTLEFQVKDVDTSGRTIVQAYTRYNVKDSDGDIGRKGMFKKTWEEDKHRIKHLLNHDTNKPLGKIMDLWEDNDYAYIRSKIGQHSLGSDFLLMANSGLITEASYGFQTIRERRTDEGNELLEVKLWEVSSLTCWGANEYTPLISVEKANSRLLSLENFCRKSTVSDEMGQLLELEMKGLKGFIAGGGSDIQPVIVALKKFQRGFESSLQNWTNTVK